MKAIEVTSLDENGSGIEFKTLVNVEEIQAIVDLSLIPKNEITGSNSIIAIRHAKNYMYVKEDYKTLSARIKFLG